MASKPGDERDGPTVPLSERVRSLRLPDSADADRAAGGWIPWALCLLLGCSTAAFAYLALANRDGQSTDPPAAPAASQEFASSTSSPTAKPKQGDVVLQATGNLTPAKQILISPKISGMVVELPIEEGQRVRKGDMLAKLETDDYQADVDRAKALLEAARFRRAELENYRPEEVAQAAAELAEAEAQRDQLRDDWERTRELYEKQVVGREEYDVAQSQYIAADRRVDRLRLAGKLMQMGPRRERQQAADAEIRQAEAELAKAEWRLKNCTIAAPVSGTILKKNAEKGNVVNPIAMQGSFSLCEMADLSDLEVELLIAERDIAKVFKGQRCEITADAFKNRVYQGHVDRIMPIADRGKAAIPIRVKVRVPSEEEGVYLKPEMGAVVVFFNEKAPSAEAGPKEKPR